jgi:membrane-bound inhibitor of C-type lysozyme
VLIIEFSVRNQRLSRYTAGVVASNSYGYLKFKFNFNTNDWQDVSVKMANFSYKGRNYPVLIDENNICTVPKEVIKTPSFAVSVFGGGITTNTVKVPVENSNTSYEEDESVSVKYYNEIINKLSATIDKLNETKADNIVVDKENNTIQLTANGAPIGDTVDYASCGIKSFDVDENDNITITLVNDRVIDLGNIAGASGATFTPHIDENKILTWTCDQDLPVPAPIDLNPFDEWTTLPEEGVESEYEWEFM